jgi:hypothetical protein
MNAGNATQRFKLRFRLRCHACQPLEGESSNGVEDQFKTPNYAIELNLPYRRLTPFGCGIDLEQDVR